MTKSMTLALALTIGGCAHHESAKMPEAPKTVTHEQLLSAKARVVELNRETRTVTLKGELGRTLRFRAGPEVRNLDQVSVGDEVAVEYYESLSMRVLDSSEAAINQSISAGARAQPGELPSGAVGEQLTFTVTVLAKDNAAGTVTIALESGEVKTVRVADPKNLELVKPNDRVAVTYTEALAMKVEKTGRE